MNSTIDTYLANLKKEMHGLDAATIRDAMADAEEHLRSALAYRLETDTGLDENAALQSIIEQYGSPAETAAAYAEVERRTWPGLSRSPNNPPRSLVGRFFGVYIDPKAWGALLFMFVSFLTGVIYFTWVTVGISLSLSFALFIFGLPIALGFLISVRGIALLEGRLVEALLGVRMPRRPLFTSQNQKWLHRLRDLLVDRHTWFAMLYMVLQLVLGTIYFTLLVLLISLSLSGFAIPVAQLVFHLPVVHVGSVSYYLPTETLPLTVLAGFLLMTITMHLARGIGSLHGKYARAILIKE